MAGVRYMFSRNVAGTVRTAILNNLALLCLEVATAVAVLK